VVVVAQHEGIREAVRTLLAPGHDVVVAAQAGEAADLNASAGPAEILLADVPSCAAPDLGWLYDWSRRWPGTTVILTVAHVSDDLRALLPALGPVRVLGKPFTRAELQAAMGVPSRS
jgi:DNA-binding NtrC family response regulator